jgi:hypothetical protein
LAVEQRVGGLVDEYDDGELLDRDSGETRSS